MKRIVLKIAYALYGGYLFIRKPLALGVRVVLIRNNEVLLIRHTYHDDWFIPGGGVEKNETLEEAAIREIWEEAGTKINSLSLMGVYSNLTKFKNDHVVVYYCDDFEIIEKRKNLEIDDVSLFDIHKLPDNMNTGSRKRVEEFMAKQYPASGLWK